MSEKLLGHCEEPRRLAEVFRTLRTNLLSRIKAGQCCFLVTSALAGEGKTSTAVGLARCLAGMRRVLLVDADLRSPQLHHWFEISNHHGLSDCSQFKNEAEIVHSVDGVSVVPAGSSTVDPQEFFMSPVFERALTYMRANYDIILFDSPPVLAVADAPLLASMVDGVIMVLRAGAPTQAEAIESVKRMESVGGQLIGCVLTGSTADSQLRSYGRENRVKAIEPASAVVHKVLLEGSR